MKIASFPRNPEHLTHPKYRADIDGLRAVAVISVVGFHAFPFWVKGGFIGVDIFFVISGYLISTIILDSLERNSFGFVEFYSRRIKRIFPALLLVLTACFAFGWFALFADEYKQLGKHIAGGAGFVSNLLFWNESGYFDNAAETKPLLHLWSLGIEEQFYIVWPLLLWGAWKQRLNLLTITIVVAVISFALNLNKVGSDAVAAFYSPQTRFWELLAGSVLAYITLHKQKFFPKFKQRLDTWFDRWLGPLVYAQAPEANGNTLRNMQSLVGAALIVVGVLFITKEKFFPGWWAVLPTLGAVLIISAGAQAWLNRAVLSNRVLVWFGLISFPLYLWHWPLLSFARIVGSEMPPREVRIAAVLISIVFAWLTYRLIEKPIRVGSHSKAKTITLLVLMMVVGYVGYNCFDRNGLFSRYTQSFNDNSIRGWAPRGEGVTSCPDFVTTTEVSLICAKTNVPNVAIIGDSHAGHLFNGFSHSKNNKFNKVVVMGAGTCQPTLGVEAIKGCDLPLMAAIDFIKKSPSIEYVILSGYYGFVDAAYSDSSKRFLEGYRRTIKELKESHKKLVFVVDNPTLKESAELCAPKPLKIRTAFAKYPSFCNGATENDLIPHIEYEKFVELLRLENPDIVFYNPYYIFCPGNKCKLFDDSKLLYADSNHLSIYGSQYLVNDLLAELEKFKF